MVGLGKGGGVGMHGMSYWDNWWDWAGVRAGVLGREELIGTRGI